METRELTKEEKQTLHLKNEPFLVYGRVVPSLKDGLWSYKIEKFLEKDIYKIAVPQELGKTPEYNPHTVNKGNRKRKNSKHNKRKFSTKKETVAN